MPDFYYCVKIFETDNLKVERFGSWLQEFQSLLVWLYYFEDQGEPGHPGRSMWWSTGNQELEHMREEERENQ